MTHPGKRGQRAIQLLLAVAAVFGLMAAYLVQPAQVTPAEAASTVLWSATHEGGNMSEWSSGGGGGIFNSGTGTASASTTVARDGRYSANMTITNASGQSQAVRLFRWAESRQNSEAYYSAWFYFPQRYSGMSWWNVFQWKSKLPNGANDPLWVLNVGNRSGGEMYFYLYDWINRKSYGQSAVNIPVGRWFHLEAYYKQATNNTGQVTFWQDGVQILNLTGVSTKRVGDEIHWSLSNYTDRISPSTATIYVDDAVISTARVGTSGTTSAPAATATPTAAQTATPTATSAAKSTPVATATPVATTAPAISGTNYYVDSVNGSDSNNGTSESSPWRTLGPVQNRTFQPGDAVNFRRGSSWTGGLTIRSSGASGKPITFRAYGTGARPVITNPGVSHGAALRIEGDYLVVQDFLLKDAHEAGVRIATGADRNVIQDNEMTAVGAGVYVTGQYNLITRNYVHDTKMIVNTSGGDDDYGANGVFLNAGNNEISYNRFERLRAPSYDYGYDGGAVELYGNISNVNVHHNTSTLSNGFMEIGGGSASNITLAYNLSDRDYSAFTMIHLSGTFASALSNMKVENNTIVKPTREWRVLDFNGTPATGAFTFRNNIVYSATTFTNNGNFARSNNLYHMLNGASLGITLGSGEKQADPMFVDYASANYHLKAGSPAMDAGLNLGYTQDVHRNPVPQGAAPDLGACEGSGNVTTPPPTATAVPPTATPTQPPSTATPVTLTPTAVPATPTPTAAPATPTPTAVPATPSPATSTPAPAATPTPTPTASIPTSGLMGYWKLDEGTGTVVNDSSGSGNKGSLFNGPTWITGRSGRALSLDGYNDYVQVPDSNALSPLASTGEITVSAWVNLSRRPSTSGQGRAPFLAKGGSNNWEYALYAYADGKVGFSTWQLNGNPYGEPMGGSLPLNGWYHLVGTAKKGQFVRTYLNGVLVAGTTRLTGTPGNGISPLYFARRGDGQYLRAAMDEVRIYNRVLSLEEIQALGR